VTDWQYGQIRRIDIASRRVTTIATTGVFMYGPMGLAVAKDGTIYVANCWGQNILKVNRQNIVTLVAGNSTGHEGGAGAKDGDFLSAGFVYPSSVVLSPDETTLYVVQSMSVRVLTLSTRTVSTIAGVNNRDVGAYLLNGGHKDDVGTAARFYSPAGLVGTPEGLLYVADAYNSLIRTVNVSSQEVTTLFGNVTTQGHQDGPFDTALLEIPRALAYDAARNVLYITEGLNTGRLRQADLALRTVTTVAATPECEWRSTM
jgi:DNA-binding beta-propeller fold protein YncE